MSSRFSLKMTNRIFLERLAHRMSEVYLECPNIALDQK
jgi:hypothetical protein